MAEPQKKRGIVGQSIVFYLSIYVFAFFKFAGGFLIAQLLKPALYGLRSVFGLVTEYEYFMHLGTYDALQREVPFHRGRQEHAEADAILDSAYSINLIYALVVSIGSLIAAQVLRIRGAAPIYIDFCYFLPAWVFIGKVGEFHRVFLVTQKEAGVLSVVNGVYGLLTAVAGVALTWQFGLRGLLVGLLVAEAVRGCWLIAYCKSMPELRLDKRILGRLYKVGFPIMVVALVFVVLRSVDRIVIATMLNTEMLGYFAIGTVVSGLIFLSVGDLARTMLFPRLMESLGAGGDTATARGFLEVPMVLLAYLVPFVIAWVYLLIPLPIGYFLPDYVPAIGVSRLLLLGSFFFSTISAPLLLLVGLDQQIRLVFMGVVAIALNIVLSVGFIRLDMGIDGVAIGTAITYFLFCAWVLTFAQFKLGTPAGSQIRFFGLVNLPFVTMTGLLWGLDRVALHSGGSLVADSALAVERGVLFTLIFGLTLIPLRNHPAFSQLIDLVRKKTGRPGD